MHLRRNNKETEFNSPKRAKTPLALHMYLSFALVIIFIFISNSVFLNTVLKSYIVSESNKRIDNAITSCQSFATAYSNIKADENENPEDIRTYLLNSVSTSTEISNEASIVLFSYDEVEDNPRYEIMWPSDNYSAASAVRSRMILTAINNESGIVNDSQIRKVTIENKIFYYKFVNVNYRSNYDDTDMEEYYLLFYVDSSAYMSFSTAVNAALFRTMIIAIIIAGIMSIITSFPIISSTKKLSKFSNRISKGDFSKFEGNIVSRELCSLSDNMNKMADRLSESDKEQKTFFQNASHELRTPLMSIQGYAEGIKLGVFDKEHESEAVDIIIDETNRLSGMVENLLSISKMDLSKSGGYKVKKTSVNVNDLVGLTIDKIRGQFITGDLELINKINIKDVYVYANENDLYRMLENIFSNAIRYTNSKVIFECTNTDSDVIFKISDDGPGISDEVNSHLFERFSKGADGKHGIGLSLVKAIADEHGGTVKAYNGDAGAVFEVSIPLFTPESQLSLLNKNSEN